MPHKTTENQNNQDEGDDLEWSFTDHTMEEWEAKLIWNLFGDMVLCGFEPKQMMEVLRDLYFSIYGHGNEGPHPIKWFLDAMKY